MTLVQDEILLEKISFNISDQESKLAFTPGEQLSNSSRIWDMRVLKS